MTVIFSSRTFDCIEGEIPLWQTWHRAVVRRAVCGEIKTEFPVSFLEKHPDSMIYVNDVASERAF